MVSEPFFQSAAAVLQERVSDWPTVASWLPPLTSTSPMVNICPAELQSVTNDKTGCNCWLLLHRTREPPSFQSLVASCYNYNEATGQAS